MKTVALLVAALVVGTTGFLIKVPTVPTTGSRLGPAPVNSGWVHLQKLILPLFENVCEESVDPIIVRLAQEFTLDSAVEEYLKPEVITNLKSLKTKGLLSKGEICTDYNTDHINELKIIYEVLVYSKNFDIFYKSACWARQNVNCGLFTRAIYLAIINRRDTEMLSVPPPYELLPNYFVKKDVIIKASALLAGEEVEFADSVRDDGNSYVLDADYTAQLNKNDEDSKLAYFYEDIGLNTYYFLQKLKRSSWSSTLTDMNTRHGEYLYHMMKQLAARYSLERYANNLPDVEDIMLNDLSAMPYDPMLVYSNGKEFGHRTSFMEVAMTSDDGLGTIENEIVSMVDKLRDTGYNKTQILNQLVDILVTGERSFETILRAFLSKDDTFTLSQPSVLDHYVTSLRDPVFWRINKKIVDLINNALKEVPVYTRNELYFPGIEVLNVDVKKVTTNFDVFQFDVSDALKTGISNTAFQVKISQQRLNHKPFVVKVSISSLVAQKGLVKIYLGPKIAPGEMVIKKNLFMLLDSFEWNFKVGSNIVSRSSADMTSLWDDFTSLRTLRKNIEDAEFGLDSLPFKDIESTLGFPQRLILPKGTSDGLPLQIFVFVAPIIKPNSPGVFSKSKEEFNSAILSPGYPLDLNTYDNQIVNLPNAMLKDILVTHKGDKDPNYDGDIGTKNWSKGNDYDLSTKPEYAAFKKEPFDYNAKKGQYGKKGGSYKKQEDFGAKREYYKGKGNAEKASDVTTTLNPNTTDDLSVRNIDFSDDRYGGVQTRNDTVEQSSDKRDPISVEEVFPRDLHEFENKNNNLSPTPRKQTIYDFIINPKDYYYEDVQDEVNIDDGKVYE